MVNDFGFQWHITDRCPNGCLHCYQDDFGGGAEMPIEALTEIAGRVMRDVDGSVCVNVTGGEPLMYGRGDGHDVFALMEHLSTYDNLDELNIITSTTGMDGSTITRLKSIPKLSAVKVSLESNDPDINDSIRGSGNFDKTTRNIAELTKAGLPVIIMATLSKRNRRSVEGLCGLATDLGARGVILERYVPLGRGVNIKDTVLTSREWTEILGTICRIVDIDADSPINDLKPYKAFLIDIPNCALGDDCSLSGAPCCLGPSSMALMPDGTVYPCRRTPIPVGKLPEDRMKDILEKLKEYSGRRQMCFDFDF